MSDLKLFDTELTKIRDDFNDYTSYVRTKALQFLLAMIAVNWAVYGKFFESNQTLIDYIEQRPQIKYSLLSSLLGIFVIVLYSYLYCIYLRCEDVRLQKDFNGSRNLFNKRNDPDSSYPYSSWTNWVPLVVDGFILICAICSVGFFAYTLF